MIAIDSKYYSSFNEMARPFYDWERQIINLGCSVTDIDIANNTEGITEEGKEHCSKLVHEYIHFLQNFSTAWGAPVFTDFTSAIMQIGASSAESLEILELPLVKSNLKSPLLIAGINQREDVIKRINKSNNSIPIKDGILGQITFTANDDICAILVNGRVKTELGIKVIRENMAHMGTQLFLGKCDEEIHTYNKNIDGFKANGIEFSNQSEYWILFEFFFEKGNFQKIAKGIFHLCQQCLITLNPEKALLRFFNWFLINNSKHNQQEIFITVIEEWLKDDNEIYYLHTGLTKSIEHCEKMLVLSKKHLSEHDIFQFAHNITEYALNNIKKTTGGRFLYSPTDNFADINYWKNKIAEYGTGIVKYSDATMIHGTSQHCNKMMDSFNFLLSSSLVLKKILENQKPTCPFLYDIPICQAEYYDSDNCHKNPFLMLQKDSSGKECLFGNGVLLIGMQNRTNFNN